MLAHPTNPDLALNLPHLEEKKIQHEVSTDNGSGAK